MEYLVCFCAASLVEKERCNKTKWSYEKVEIAACVVGRARDCVRRSLAKVLFAVEGNKLWSHCEFVFLVISGRSMWSRENVAQTRARCRSGIRHRIRHSQFWG